MKYIFSILFACFSFCSFGQMSMREMMRIHNMDMDQFESYAIGKGYQLNNFDTDDNLNGIVYVKGIGKQTKYLKLYDKFYAWGTTVDFQTTNSVEVLNIKNQSAALGFKLYNSYFNEETLIKEYSNKKNILRIFTIPPSDDANWETYEVSFSNF